MNEEKLGYSHSKLPESADHKQYSPELDSSHLNTEAIKYQYLITRLAQLGIKSSNNEQIIGAFEELKTNLETAQLLIEKLVDQSSYDPVAGCYSRSYFNDLINNKFDIQRDNNNKAIIFIDANKFKQVNDILGHDAGDETLRVIATFLKSSFRKADDFVARYGGDEFVIICENKNDDDKFEENLKLKTKDLLSDGIKISLLYRDSENHQGDIRRKVRLLEAAGFTVSLLIDNGNYYINFIVDVSHGIAVYNQIVDGIDDNSIKNTIRRSDNDMYRYKNEANR